MHAEKQMCNFNELLGKTIVQLTGLEIGSGKVYLQCSDGSEYMWYHEQD